jgi:pantoate--beta-alanine ligase
MLIFKKIEQIQLYLNKERLSRKRIGFVPTMGALHEGHLSLVKASQKDNQLTVCSIFVNPTQFNNAADLQKYPRTTEQDIELLTGVCCDILFMPEVGEIYPEGQKLTEQYDLGYVEMVLEGAFRPGHFQGVAQVVEKLLDIVQPDQLYLGQKDYQQCAVLKKLIEIKNLPVHLNIVPTMREADGLAMSSRNRRLTEPQRNLAGIIYQCLVSIQAKKGVQSFSIVKKECMDILEKKGFKPEYIELANANTLELLPDYADDIPMVALIAAFMGDIRLIDNLVL